MKNNLLAQALSLAADVHSGQKWRDEESPYLSHPLAVASLVLRFGGDEEQAAAALVHDTISDSRGSAQELSSRLTAEVSRIAYVFSDPVLEEPSSDWHVPKRAYLSKIRETDLRALLVVGAEELHELTDLLQELRQRPPTRVWARYPTHSMNVAWYFKEVLAILNSRIKEGPARSLVAEMAFRVRQLNALVFEGGAASTT